jgi:succinate-semialdehyde dehydrogenase/glutarate-semialdehyde dehydrogenase
LVFEEYRLLNPRTWAKLLFKWNALITEALDDLAKIPVQETGKLVAEAYGKIGYVLSFTWWFAGEPERIQGTTSTSTASNRREFTVKQSIGVAVALVPWNFPVEMSLLKVGVALAAGCTMIIKPPPETPHTCLTLAHLATKSGLAAGVFSVLTTDLEKASDLSEASASTL